MANCKEIKAIIDLYLDNSADDPQKKELFSHLQICEGCRNRFEETSRLHSMIKSVPTMKLPEGFRRKLITRIQDEGHDRQRNVIPLRNLRFSAISWASAAILVLLILSIVWLTHNPERAVAASEIHVVSPRENAVVEQQYVDISAAFTLDDLKNIRVILDGRDVTDYTEINEGFFIYTSDTLQSGYHIATVQVIDSDGMPITERSWSFYVIQSEPS